MKSFEEFKAAREKTDPSAKKLTDRQWEQAYHAYVSSRERVRSKAGKDSGKTHSGGGHGSTRESDSSGAREDFPTPGGEFSPRARIRARSAYDDTRVLIDILAGIAAVMSLVGIFFGLADSAATVGSGRVITNGVLQIIAALAFRFLAQALLDIPDIALARMRQEAKELRGHEASETDPGE